MANRNKLFSQWTNRKQEGLPSYLATNSDKYISPICVHLTRKENGKDQTIIFKVQKPTEALIYMSRSRSRVIHFCKKFWILSRDPVILMICCPLKIVHISCSSLLEIPKFQSGLGAITDKQHTDTKIYTVYVH